ncbi:pyruvate decarboxylase [Trametopsis cervina]|nr:pyruvate decarboxylase [Trametopsis cervina]
MSSKAVASLQASVNRLKHELTTMQVSDSIPGASDSVTIADYLLERLAQLNVTHMFGLPGDFNLGFLDYVEDHPKIEWAGNCNELNAAYAADGYARVKEGSIGVLLTTFGVGELSATNGVAGAFSERVPVLHIVGVPSTAQQKSKPMLHHTLGDGRYDAYHQAAKNFAISHASLEDVATAAAEIDRVLTDVVIQARPGYLMLPTDLVHEQVSRKRLLTPLNTQPPENDEEIEGFVLDEIIKLIDEADRDAVILLDACTIRHNVREETKIFAEKTKFPVFAAPMGKTAISEQYERYGGIYVGTISRPEIKAKVESAKLIISIGGLKSDFNTGNFTYQIPTTRTVELHSDHTKIQYAVYHGIGMKRLLPKLTERLHPFKADAEKLDVPRFLAPVPQESDDVVTHSWLWPRVSEFFKSGDVVVAETGTSSFGILDVPLPQGSVFVSQILWGSIGWTVGSTLGAAIAARDLGLGRTILFIGDGSIQLTVQELSVMMRVGVKPIIFLLNNNGYTIERLLHGEKRKYNDITNWNWTALLSAFGGIEGKTCQSYTVKNKPELSALLDNPDFAKADKIQLVEILMPTHDAPRALRVQAELSGKTNKYIAMGVKAGPEA